MSDGEGEGITTGDRKLLDAFHAMKVQPRIECPEDLMAYMRRMGREEESMQRSPFGRDTSHQASKAHHFPKLSMFFGEEGKGEVNWQSFKFEISALLAENAFTEEQILLGIRRAAKGNASDVIRRLGIGAKTREVLEKLESTFGNVESDEILLRKFYACEQEKKENVATYASRVEEMFARAVSLGILDKRDDKVLKKVFYQGLKSNIKQIAYSKCDLIREYVEFKTEVRKIEADLTTPEKEEEKKQCAAATHSHTEKKSELSEVKDLLKKLNDRIDRLEGAQAERRYGQGREQQTDRRYGHGRGEMTENRYDYGQEERYGQGQANSYRGRGRSQYRGRGGYSGRGYGNNRGYRPSRPTASNNMRPRCYNCDRPGHFARDCREDRDYPKD